MTEQLNDLNLKIQYDSFDDRPMEDFLVPALGSSKTYDRAVGYFSSALFAVIPEAFTNFGTRGGKMRLVCSPILSIADASLFENLSESEVDSYLLTTMQSLLQDDDLRDPLLLTSWLVKTGALEIRIAVPKIGTAGIFHQKIGIFSDQVGNKVAFSGSNNETLKAWGEFTNSESFTVHKSWNGDSGVDYVDVIQEKFDRFWRNKYSGFDFLPLKEARSYLVATAPSDADIVEIKKRIRSGSTKSQGQTKPTTSPKRQPAFKELRDYQSKAVDGWFHRKSGIVSFATGAGKTVTALEIVRRWSHVDDGNSALILVPSVRLQEQWVNEILSYRDLGESSVLLVGGKGQASTWNMGLAGYTAGRVSGDFCITVAVMDSAAKQRFVSGVAWSPNLLVVADEMHNLGAPSFSSLLSKIAEVPRLGLSATPERYEEDETHTLKRTFGDEIDPVIGIADALELGVLVPYTYHFAPVRLNVNEEADYRKLTERIRKLSSPNKGNGKTEMSQSLKMAILTRARILKEAAIKVDRAAEIIFDKYKPGDSWLLFCSDQKQLNNLRDRLVKFKPLTYHQGMDGDSDNTIREYVENGGILLSINMLTEGVDIPRIDKCVILASSQNKREYIQRRGRVLRVNPRAAKDVHIWDLMVVDAEGFAYTDPELDRAKEFARNAKNSAVIFDLERLARVKER